MCPSDDSHLTLEFQDHYVLMPTIKFNNTDVDYSTNAIGEQGHPVKAGFEYNSGNNPQFLSVDEIKSSTGRPWHDSIWKTKHIIR